jgi:hypothetical protein
MFLTILEYIVKYMLPILIFYIVGLCIIRMIFQNLLWYCAGANIELLEKCTNDHSRYQNIGASIVMTSILAWISMGFAMYSIFESFIACFLIGFVWACMIFVLDRTIVTSMRKPIRGKIVAQGQVVWGIQGSSKEWLFVLIRFVIAILISMIITKPLEIKIFETTLTTPLNNMKDEQTKKDNAGIQESTGITQINQGIDAANTTISNFDARINKRENSPEHDALQQQYDKCKNDIKGQLSRNDEKITTQTKRIGELSSLKDNSWALTEIKGCKETKSRLIQERNNIEAPCNAINSKMIKKDKEHIDNLNKQKGEGQTRFNTLTAEKGKAEVIAVEEGGKRQGERNKAFGAHIIAQIQALEKLKSDNWSMFITSWLITLMFIIIETAPVLAKFMSSHGDYDDAFEAAEIEHWIKLQEAKALQIKQMNEKVIEADASMARNAVANANIHENALNQQLTLESAKQATKNKEELDNYNELVKRIADAQKEIAEKQVEIWREEQLKKLNNNLPSNP